MNNTKNVWTVEEETLIKKAYEEDNIKDWSTIARILQDHGHPRKSSKQCRERYSSYLNLDILIILQARKLFVSGVSKKIFN